jgi:predicted site-specific integrase-resolvase
MKRRLVPTGDAADALGIDRSTLIRWWQAGHVQPASITLGGHARWDVDDLRRQIDDWRRRLVDE